MSVTSGLAVSNALAVTPSAPVAMSNVAKQKRKVKELDCSEVRWFYRREADTKWTAFRGYDSLVLEVSWRTQKGIPLDEKTAKLNGELPTTTRVIVLDGLYQLNDKQERDKFVESIYWKDENLLIRRGTWFYADSMQPVSEDLANAVEDHHLTNFRGQAIPDSPVFSEAESSKKPVLTSLRWMEHDEVRWNSVIDVSFYANPKGNRFIRFVTRSKGIEKLKRGYSEEAQLSDGQPNFSDLILVIHGVGQKGYENLIAKNTAQIREGILQLMEKNYPEEKRRPMILPIEWRSTLKLDGDMTDFITLPRMSSFRQTLNSVGLDIMYYQSPLYRTEIVNGVIRTMNCVFDTFRENNPNFNGSVSIFAHSLGSVIAYDIVTNWSPLLLYDEFVTNAIKEQIDQCTEPEEREILEQFHDSRMKLLETGGRMQEILLRREDRLHFKVKNLFAIGSPLAVFLVMRGVDCRTVIPDPEHLQHIFNIFHPYDPVAYRLEALFHENYRHLRPLKLLNYSDAKRNYNKMRYECHKSYVKKSKKGEKEEKKKEFKLDDFKPEVGEDFMDDDDDDDSDGVSSVRTGCSSPRSESPAPPDEDTLTAESIGKEPVTTNLTKAGTSTKSGSWWKFGSGGSDQESKKVEEVAKEAKENGTDLAVPPPPPKRVNHSDALLEQIPTERRVPVRLDYQLQTGAFEKSYWSVIKSHFSYWTNMDLLAFVLNTLYPVEDDKSS